jgi:Sulfotransferase domain
VLAGRGPTSSLDKPQPVRQPTDLILCTGMPRSGSTWSFNVCMSLLESAHPGASIVAFYSADIRAILADRVADYLVIKCHNVDEAGHRAIGRGECRTIYTYRNPCEAVTSFIVFADVSFVDALASIKASLEFMTFQRRYGDALFLSYTELNGTPQQAIRKIADHLGPAGNEAAITAADHRSSRQEAAAVAEKVETLTPAEVYQDDKYLYHRRSLIHRNHLTGGGARWRCTLTPSQIAQVHYETRLWADLFGG